MGFATAPSHYFGIANSGFAFMKNDVNRQGSRGRFSACENYVWAITN